jgi:hypothetical protein
VQIFVKGAIQIIDPLLFMGEMKAYRNSAARPVSIDLYWDLMPFMEIRNKRCMKDGASFMRAVVFEDDLIDYGTPERLELTRRRYTPSSISRVC